MVTPDTRIAVIGAGFGGLCAAIKLKEAGFESLVIFDKSDRVGGTWQANTYPGVECDVPSHLYSYSFHKKGDWTRKWSPQPEILAYIEDCVRHFDLSENLRLGTEIASCEFDEESSLWLLCDAAGATYQFDFVVFALGQLSRPKWPDIAGLVDFAGDCFHSSRWRHDCDLTGKSVAVIGNAASALQLIPRIAPLARQLTVYQRSANWVLRKKNRRYLKPEKWLASRIPGIAWLYRAWIWLYGELLVYPLTGSNRLMKSIAGGMTRRYLRDAIRDEELREKLIPEYPFGAKRILFSDDYYAALDRDNVRLETSPVSHIRTNAIECESGHSQVVDAIILATGFQTTDFLAPVRITGRDGKRLEDVWRGGAEAYLGIATYGFPNLFMMYGPNTNLGHSSIISMLECQARYIVSCLRAMGEQGLRRVEVRKDVQTEYNRQLNARLAGKTWADVEESWYLRNGRNTNNWPGTTVEYRWRTRHCDLNDYDTGQRPIAKR